MKLYATTLPAEKKCFQAMYIKSMAALKSKRILITGAAGGIGSSTTDILLKSGAGVLATDTHRDGLLQLKHQHGGAVEIHEGDLTDPSFCDQLPGIAQSKLGGLDAVVNIGSIEGLACNPEHAAYAASKAALHALTRATAVDHGREIRCNAIAPGWIDTQFNDGYIESMPDPAGFRANLSGIHPAGRTGTAGDVARLLCFLASEQAAFISGQTYVIDGGRTIQLPLP